MLNAIKKKWRRLFSDGPRRPVARPRLGVELLEAREVPTALYLISNSPDPVSTADSDILWWRTANNTVPTHVNPGDEIYVGTHTIGGVTYHNYCPVTISGYSLKAFHFDSTYTGAVYTQTTYPLTLTSGGASNIDGAMVFNNLGGLEIESGSGLTMAAGKMYSSILTQTGTQVDAGGTYTINAPYGTYVQNDTKITNYGTMNITGDLGNNWDQDTPLINYGTLNLFWGTYGRVNPSSEQHLNVYNYGPSAAVLNKNGAGTFNLPYGGLVNSGSVYLNQGRLGIGMPVTVGTLTGAFVQNNSGALFNQMTYTTLELWGNAKITGGTYYTQFDGSHLYAFVSAGSSAFQSFKVDTGATLMTGYARISIASTVVFDNGATLSVTYNDDIYDSIHGWWGLMGGIDCVKMSNGQNAYFTMTRTGSLDHYGNRTIVQCEQTGCTWFSSYTFPTGQPFIIKCEDPGRLSVDFNYYP